MQPPKIIDENKNRKLDKEEKVAARLKVENFLQFSLNVEEYKKRSPAWQAHKLETPLLIHTNTNDGDVNVFEVEHLIKSLKAEGKEFEYEIYQEIPGGHSFDRIDTKKAQEVRVKIYQFLAGYLNPSQPINDIKSLRKAAYRF